MAQRLSRAKRKQQTRDQLIEAAFRCFEANGFAATTLEQVAEEAGVTTGAVYSNFANKEALFLELLGRIDAQPVDVSMLGDASRNLGERFRDFGEVNARTVDLSPSTMATWYEVRSFALRNPRARAAAHDAVLESIEAWGERIDRLAPQVGTEPVVSGTVVALITQALLDGLRGMRAFLPDEVTAEVHGEATRLLAHLFDPHDRHNDGVTMANSKKNADKKSGSEPKLLSGGNPQIPKGEGDEPVQAYIAAMPGWKRSLGKRLHALIVDTVPDVHKAVKWNQPFYGHEGDGWFLAFRCYTKYVQLQFFRGTSLDPVPPKASKHDEVRYLDIHEGDDLDEDQLVSWIEQASNLPGEKM